MKKIKLIIQSIFWLAVISIGLFFYLRAGAQYNTMEVGFYGLPESTEAVLIDWLNDRNIDWKPIIYDDSRPLEDQLQVPSPLNLLFTTDSKNMDSIAPYVRTAKTNNLLLMPISIRTAVQTGGRLTATPILLDHFQFSYNVDILRNLAVAIPTNFTDLEVVGQTVINNRAGTSSTAPILCAGGDDTDLIQFFSAMLETMQGIENYEIAQSLLEQAIIDVRGNDLLESTAFDTFFSLPQVANTLQKIVAWERSGYLSSSWLSLSREDITRSMENNSAVFTFLPFSTYETLSQRAKNLYAPWFMPSGGIRETRYLVAPSIVVMEFSYVKSPLQSARQSAKKNNLASSLIGELVSGFVQTELSEATHLVPVNATAMVSEEGTGETRQLFTLADGIISDISTATFVRQGDKIQFAQALRSEISKTRTEM